MSSLRLPAAALAAVLLAACAAPPQRPADLGRNDYRYARDYLAWYIDQERRAKAVPGVSIALVEAAGPVWIEGFGEADQERGTRADADTLYRVGGLAEPITAAAALRLAAAGRFDLDRPLGAYLSGFRMAGPGVDAITPRLLMSHHAGLPSFLLGGRRQAQPPAFTDLAASLAEQPLAAPPGTQFAYSELGYSLLGHALEVGVGQPFADYARQAVLAPLGMDHSAFSPTPPQGGRAAANYEYGEPAPQWAVRDVPAAGLTSSARDLARFVQALLGGGGPVLAPAGMAEMLRVQNADVPLDLDAQVALGWSVAPEPVPGGGRWLYSFGAGGGQRGYMAILPDHGLGVVVLANADRAPVVDIGKRALQRLFEAKTGMSWPDEAAEPADGPAPALAGLDGWYDTVAGFARVTRAGDALEVRLNDQTLRLRPVAGNRFALEKRVLGLIPVELDRFGLSLARIDGREVLVYQRWGRRLPIGERLTPQPLPAAWRARTGDYTLVDPVGEVADWARDGRIRVVERDGFLLALTEHGGKSESVMVIRPLDDTRAVVAGIGSDRGQAVRVVRQEGEERVLYSGLVLRRGGE